MNPDSILNLLMSPSKENTGSKSPGSRSQDSGHTSLSFSEDISCDNPSSKSSGKLKKKNSFRKKLTQKIAAVTGSPSSNNNNIVAVTSRVKKSSSCIASIIGSSSEVVISSDSDEDLRCYDFTGGDERCVKC